MIEKIPIIDVNTGEIIKEHEKKKGWTIERKKDNFIRWKSANGYIFIDIEKNERYPYHGEKGQWCVQIGYKDFAAYTFFCLHVVDTKKEAFELAKNLMIKYRHLRTKEEVEKIFRGR